MKILDIGCGTGTSPLYADHDVVGIDIDPERVAIARQKHPNATFYVIPAECMSPLPDEEFDAAVSGVAIPYMDIPVVLAEVYRVLRRGATLRFTLHSASLTLGELRQSFPVWKPTLFRLFVLANGLWFHATGRVLRVGGKCESCQTERGIRRALGRAGFANIQIERGRQFVVTAQKPAGR